MMKRWSMLLCLALAFLSLSGNARAYTAEIAYYFQGLDVSTGTVYTDPMTFIILPVDEVEQTLKPPADILPQFDPAVDVFVDYDPATDVSSLVFLPKAADDPERMTAVTIGGETFPVDFSGELVTLNMPENPVLLTFQTMDTQIEVELTTAYGFPEDSDTVPEPSTFLLFGLGMLALFGWRGRKKIRPLKRWLLLVFLMAGILVPEIALAGFCENVTEIPAIECEALAALYDSTNGDNWLNNSGWLQDPLVSQWHGVTVREGHVTGINLAVNELTGTVSPELGNLEKLVSLSLWRNALSGTIPATLGNLQDLEYLILEENELTGTIPQQIGNLIKLKRLFLCYNQLTGSIPATLGNLTNLEHFLLQYNQLSGEIPPELGNLTNVIQFRLDKNLLTGSIPADLGNLSPEKLIGLFLAGNQLTGTIPSTLGNLSALTGLQLDNNQLSGEIPPELGNLTNLTALALHVNQLSGPIPPELGNLINLEGLRLFENQLSASIPPELGNLSHLKECLLHSNQLTGEIPASLANLTKLDGFSSHYNFLEGCLPIELMPHTDPDTGEETGWLAIQSFSFHAMYDGKIVKEPSDPDFQAWLGTIPTLGRTNVPCETSFACENVTEIPQTECEALVALYNSTDGDHWSNNSGWLQTNTPLSTPWYGIEYSDSGHVTTLSLGGNNLQGPLPAELAQLTELEWLELWENGLTGSILPVFAASNSFSHLRQLSLSKNHLDGTIPAQLGALSQLRNLDLAENQFDGVIPPELGNLSNLETLSLFKNQLTGSLPPELGNLFNLKHFNAFGNQLNGELPPEFEKLENLVSLALNHNYFTGSIPPEWGDPEGGYLRSLQSLFLTANELSGSIPTEFCNLTNLKELYVHDTSLSGPLPECLACDSPPNLEVLHFEETNICETNQAKACLDAGQIPELGRTGRSCSDPILLGWNLRGESPHTPPTLACYSDGVQTANNTSWNVGSAVWETVEAFGSEPIFYCLQKREVEQSITDPSIFEPKEEWPQSCEHLYSEPYSDEGDEFPFSQAENGKYYETRVIAINDVNGNTQYDPGEEYGESNSCYIRYKEVTTWNSGCHEGQKGVVDTIIGVHDPTIPVRYDFPDTMSSFIIQVWGAVDFTTSSGDAGQDLGNGTWRFGAEEWIEFINTSESSSFLVTLYIFINESGTAWANTGILPNSGIIFDYYPFFLSSQTEVLSIPAASSPRDIEVTFLIGDLNNDDRVVHVEARAGDVSRSVTYNNQDYSFVLNETLVLPDVPGNVIEVSMTVTSQPENGDSVFWMGANVNVPCQSFCENVTEIPRPECEALKDLFNDTSGESWLNNTNWFETDTPSDWYGVTVENGHVSNLSLPHNNLVGELPSSLGNLSEIKFLNLWDNAISGTIPAELGNLYNLLELSLGDNDLEGTIPPEIWNLPKLIKLHLHGNRLTGGIPPEIGKLADTLQELLLSNNQFYGELPAEMGKLVNLRNLQVNLNQFTGPLPEPVACKLPFEEPLLEILHFGNTDICETETIKACLDSLGIPDWARTGQTCQFFDYFMYEYPTHIGRFHDADKTGNNDTYKCHAAASSNILDWGGWDVPPEFDVEQQIFGNFQINWEDKGSLVRYLTRWWLDGTPPPELGEDWATIIEEGGGYFPTGTGQSNFAGAYLSHWTQASLIETVKSYLHSGYGTSIALYDSADSAALGHVLSVWGYRYDADGNVLGLWVTDSDDVSSEPPQEWLLPVEYSTGGGSEAKWRVSAGSERYAGWLIEGVEALKPRAETTPQAETPKLAIVRKKCVDNETGEEIACPSDDNVTIWIGDQLCDDECKRISATLDDNTALMLKFMIEYDPENPVTFEGLEVNGELWPGGPIYATDDLYLRPVIGCKHD